MDWIIKGKDFKSDADVSITLTKNEGELKRVCITFRNNCSKAISPDYVKIGIAANRMYFAPASQREGYKQTFKGKNKNRYLAIVNDSLVDWCKDKIGDYNLMYDKEEKLYYIEKPYIAWTEKGYHC